MANDSSSNSLPQIWAQQNLELLRNYGWQIELPELIDALGNAKKPGESRDALVIFLRGVRTSKGIPDSVWNAGG